MPSRRAAGRISAANPPAWGLREGELEGQARPSNLVSGEEGGRGVSAGSAPLLPASFPVLPALHPACPQVARRTCTKALIS